MIMKIQTNGCFSNALLFQPSLDRQVLGTAYAYMWNPPGKLAERMDGFVTRLFLGTGNISISYRAHSRSYTMGALRYGKGLGQAARLKRGLVGIGQGHRKLSKVFFREIIQHEQAQPRYFSKQLRVSIGGSTVPHLLQIAIRRCLPSSHRRNQLTQSAGNQATNTSPA